MKKLETSLPGVIELLPAVSRDSRGYFLETYHQAKFAALGIREDFVQDNHSFSVKGTLRGLHYQLRRPQAKLCRLVGGEALDVVVDIRVGSPQFGKCASVRLSAARQNLIYIPAGFAHGYLALSESVQFLYKCSEFYEPADEYGILWNDPALEIPWHVKDPIVSTKDAALPPLSRVPLDLLPQCVKSEPLKPNLAIGS